MELRNGCTLFRNCGSGRRRADFLLGSNQETKLVFDADDFGEFLKSSAPKKNANDPKFGFLCRASNFLGFLAALYSQKQGQMQRLAAEKIKLGDGRGTLLVSQRTTWALAVLLRRRVELLLGAPAILCINSQRGLNKQSMDIVFPDPDVIFSSVSALKFRREIGFRFA